MGNCLNALTQPKRQNRSNDFEAPSNDFGRGSEMELQWQVQWPKDLSPNYINHVQRTDQENEFLVSADENLFLIRIEDGFITSGWLEQAHKKQVNMCLPMGSQGAISCSREPVIRMWDMEEMKETGHLEGHEMSVSAIAVNPGASRVASGGRDAITKVWDIAKEKTILSRRIDRNIITSHKWLPDSRESFVQCSEDLYLRLWDIRAQPFKPQIEFIQGSNFATTCDI